MQDAPITQHEYLTAARCPRRFYEGRFAPAESGSGSVDRSERFAFEQVERVRRIAQELYAERTECAFNVGVHALGCIAVVDILERRGDGSVRPIVVQPYTGLKPNSLELLRFQTVILRESGYNARGGAVVRLEKSYVRGDSLDPAGLLVEEECRKQVNGGLKAVRNRIARIAEVLDRAELPEPCDRRDRCPVCSRPATNRNGGSIDSHTESTTIDTGIHTLFLGHGLIAELERDGFTDLSQVPPSRLPGRRQKLQVRAVRERRRHVDCDALREFVAQCRYPRVFLDFETVSMAVPPVAGVRPWEHVPIQFSVHRQEAPDGPVSHREFLAEDLSELRDSTRELAEALVHAVSGAGSALAFSASFERRMLHLLARRNGQYSRELRNTADRLVDIQEPFVRFMLYEPAQQGRTGLKAVLPAVTGADYDHLEIADGRDASLTWYYEYRGVPGSPQRERAAEALREYCALDTLALVDIVRHLEEIVGGKECTGGEETS